MARKPRFVKNLRSGIIHKLPTVEQCNVDQVPKKYRHYSRDFSGPMAGLCGHCFR